MTRLVRGAWDFVSGKGRLPDLSKPFGGLRDVRCHKKGRFFDTGGPSGGYTGTCRSSADGSEGGDGITVDEVVHTAPVHNDIPSGVVVYTFKNKEYWFNSISGAYLPDKKLIDDNATPTQPQGRSL